jgi:hypothetical protein
VKVETLKNQAARAMGEVNKLKGDSPKKDPVKVIEEALSHDVEEIPGLKKKVKDLEGKIIKLWAEKDIYKSELEKSKQIIEWEIGDGKSIDELLRDDGGWKGRAEKIQILKNKLKKAKETYGDGVSTVSFTTEHTMMSGTKTHAEKNLERIDGNRTRENEALKEEIGQLRDILKQTDDKMKGAVARKKVLENEMKTIWEDFQGKIKILLGKSENDDKLIIALKAELGKSKSGGTKPTKSDGKIPLDGTETLYHLKNDNAKLKNDIFVQETEVMMRDRKISELEELIVSLAGNPDERVEERE